MLERIPLILEYHYVFLCSIYIFVKAVRRPFHLKQFLLWNPMAVAAAALTLVVRLYCPALTLLPMLAILLLCCITAYKKNFFITLFICAAALTAAHAVFEGLLLPAVGLRLLLGGGDVKLFCIALTLCGMLELIATRQICAKGWFGCLSDAAENKRCRTIVLAACFIDSLAFMGIFTVAPGAQLLPFTLTASLMGVFIVWLVKSFVTDEYLRRLQQRDNDKYKSQLAENEHSLTELQQENRALAKIIHRDNKLLPAMEMAVEEVLSIESPDEQKRRSMTLLADLRELAAERLGIVGEYEAQSRELPKTHVASVDACLRYLMQKAQKMGIMFDVSVISDVSSHIGSVVTETDFNTLLLEHGENALLAAAKTKVKHVLVVLGIENNVLRLDVYDSGVRFDETVKQGIGEKQVTTRRAEGGSGLGLLTSAALMEKYSSSLKIDETIGSNVFSKKISVCFDGVGELSVVS